MPIQKTGLANQVDTAPAWRPAIEEIP
jgi:hypothetical protein